MREDNSHINLFSTPAEAIDLLGSMSIAGRASHIRAAASVCRMVQNDVARTLSRLRSDPCGREDRRAELASWRMVWRMARRRVYARRRMLRALGA